MTPVQALRRVIGLAATRPVELAMSAGLVVVLSLVELPLPIFMAVLIDGIIPADDTTALILVGSLLFAIRSAASLFQVFQNYLVARMTSRFSIMLRQNMVSKILRLPFTRYLDASAKGMITRLVQDVQRTEDFAGETVSFMIRPFFSFVFLFVVMFIWNWVLALYCLLAIPLVMYASRGIRNRMEDASRKQRKFSEALEVTASEAFGGIRSIRACGAEGQFETRFFGQSAEIETASVHYNVWNTAANQIINLIRSLSNFGFILVAGFQVFEGRLSIGGFVALHQLSLGLSSPIAQIMYFLSTVSAKAVTLERVDEVCNAPTEHDQRQNAKPFTIDRGEIVFDHVELRFGDARILKQINLNIRPGESIALVGPSGAGKTSLTNVLLALFDLSGGSISVDGHHVGHADLASLRRGIGIVFQDPQMFNNTVRYNLQIAHPDASDEHLWAALAKAHADDFIRNLPKGLDTVIGVNGIKLSGGQKQRLSIARTLLCDPKIIILDEATSSLDSTTEHEIQAAIDETLRGRTSIVIAHRLSTILNADRIAVFDHGDIIAIGSHQDLLAQNQALYQELYQTQTEFMRGT
jgi:ABC-type multidrug transport system fused ATPase/permease subunit